MAGEKLTRKWLKNHLTYSWWKYLLMTVLCVFGVEMLFTVTAYRPPEEKKIELYVCNSYVDAQALQEALSPLFFEAFPDQEELTVLNINLASDDIYAAMQFSTYAAARQGDVCLLPLSEVKKLSVDGAEYAFTELTPYLESGAINAQGIDLTNGRCTDQAGVEGVYGIPADTLGGLRRLGNDPANSVLCIMNYSGNEDHAAAVVDLLIRLYGGEEAPDGAAAEAPKSSGTIFQ